MTLYQKIGDVEYINSIKADVTTIKETEFEDSLNTIQRQVKSKRTELDGLLSQRASLIAHALENKLMSAISLGNRLGMTRQRVYVIAGSIKEEE
jgi:hypothetical protein